MPSLTLRDRFVNYVSSLQEVLCEAVQEKEGKKKFELEEWSRHAGGGGRFMTIRDGRIFESAVISTAVVFGELTDLLQRVLHTNEGRFFAVELSAELHPQNPMVPAAHLNLRYWEIREASGRGKKAEAGGQVRDAWYAGSTSLTPAYLWEEDVVHFHGVLRDVCNEYHEEFYPLFKHSADEYFFLPHRSELRGTGGLYFDHLRAEDGFTLEDRFELVTSIGDMFTDAYMPLVEKRYAEPFTDEHRQFQELRRGRYAEFALLYDRNLLLNLQNELKPEVALVQLPPRARWDAGWQPKHGSREESLQQALQPRDWLAAD